MAEVVKKFVDNAIPSKEEIGAMKLIIIKKQVAFAGTQNREFPDGVDQTIITAYYKAAMDNYAEAQHMENEWWNMMTIKFNLIPGTHFDFELERFYILEEVKTEK